MDKEDCLFVLRQVHDTLVSQFEHDTKPQAFVTAFLLKVLPLLDNEHFDQLQQNIARQYNISDDDDDGTETVVTQLPDHLWGKIASFWSKEDCYDLRIVNRAWNNKLATPGIILLRRNENDTPLYFNNRLLDSNDNSSVWRDRPLSMIVKMPTKKERAKLRAWMKNPNKSAVFGRWCRTVKNFIMDDGSDPLWEYLPINDLFGHPNGEELNITASFGSLGKHSCMRSLTTFKDNYNVFWRKHWHHNIVNVRNVNHLTMSHIYSNGSETAAKTLCAALCGNYKILSLHGCDIKLDNIGQVQGIFHERLQHLNLGIRSIIKVDDTVVDFTDTLCGIQSIRMEDDDNSGRELHVRKTLTTLSKFVFGLKYLDVILFPPERYPYDDEWLDQHGWLHNVIDEGTQTISFPAIDTVIIKAHVKRAIQLHHVLLQLQSLKHIERIQGSLRRLEMQILGQKYAYKQQLLPLKQYDQIDCVLRLPLRNEKGESIVHQTISQMEAWFVCLNNAMKSDCNVFNIVWE